MESLSRPDNTCSIDDCDLVARGHRYCNKHYLRWTRHGDPLAGGVFRPNLPKGCCSVDGCPKGAHTAGMCHMHYKRWKTHGDHSVVMWHNGIPQGGSPNLQRDELGRKRCTACDKWLAPELFKANPRMADGLLSYCKRCYQDRDYNLTPVDRDNLLEGQNGLCAVVTCGKSLELYGPNTYFVDHDHQCCPGLKSCGSCVRGLLCNQCNRILGFVHDDEKYLAALADYLSRKGNPDGSKQ